MNALLMVTASIVLSAVAQIILKHGTNRMASRINEKSSVAALLSSALHELYVWLWAGCFVIATALWLLAVQHLDLSYAFPLLSAGYVLVTILSIVLIKERVDVTRWIAIAIICCGVILIARS